MIVPPTSVRVFVATKPVDFRKGMDGLAAIVEGELKLEPFSGVIYVFRAKRIEGSKFHWPRIEDGVMRLSPAQLSALLEGLDWSRVHARRVARPTATQ